MNISGCNYRQLEIGAVSQDRCNVHTVLKDEQQNKISPVNPEITQRHMAEGYSSVLLLPIKILVEWEERLVHF